MSCRLCTLELQDYYYLSLLKKIYTSIYWFKHMVFVWTSRHIMHCCMDDIWMMTRKLPIRRWRITCQVWMQHLFCSHSPDSNDFPLIHPWKLTWNPKIQFWKIIFLFERLIFRFHVNFPGCILSLPLFPIPKKHNYWCSQRAWDVESFAIQTLDVEVDS